MKEFKIEISQNGWEYTGFAFIQCNELKKDLESNKVIYADGVRIEFDEEIGHVKQI